jgi:hypothetical protein
MRSKSRAKRSNTELNPLIGDFINTIGSKPVSLGVSKCFPVCPRKRASDPSQSAPGIIPHTQEHAPSHGGALGRALARRARPRLRHRD